MLSYMLPPVLEEKPLNDTDSSESTEATVGTSDAVAMASTAATTTTTAEPNKSTVPIDKLNRTKLHLHFLVDQDDPLQKKITVNNNLHKDHAVIVNGHNHHHHQQQLHNNQNHPVSNGYGNNNTDTIVTKNPTLKRVSFGSSKGSMVETLIFDSPVQQEDEDGGDSENKPLIDHMNNNRLSQIDNTDEISDNEYEKEKVRVSFFQQIEPQSITGELYDLIDANQQSLSFGNSLTVQCTNPLCSTHFTNNSSNCLLMSTKCPLTNSMDNGWENPFRPDGELSREADQIVQMIKGGKPITPTSPIESKPFGATDLPDANNSSSLLSAGSPNGKNATNRNGDMSVAITHGSGNGKNTATANGNGLMKNGNSPTSKHTQSQPNSPQQTTLTTTTIVNNDKNVQHDRIEPLQSNLERIEKEQSRCRCCLLQ